MPNVNYRGKLLSKDPDLMTEEELSAAFEAMPLPARQEAMKRALDEEIGPVAMMSPTSGLTSIPLGAPWPPLSREQVVELHQELVEFYAGMKRCVDLGINDSARAAYAERLTIVLHRLGIGSPPPTRTWTHEEVAKVAEEVQQRSGLPRHAEGRAPTTATELAITAAMEDRFGHITDLSRHSKPREEPTTDEDSGPGAMSWQQAEEFGSPFATEPPVVPPKRNCWTCRLGSEQFCSLTQGANVGTAKREDVVNWRLSHLQVTQQTDGCPGWEPKP